MHFYAFFLECFQLDETHWRESVWWKLIQKLNAADKSKKGKKRKEFSVGDMLRDTAKTETHDLMDDSSDHSISSLFVNCWITVTSWLSGRKNPLTLLATAFVSSVENGKYVRSTTDRTSDNIYLQIVKTVWGSCQRKAGFLAIMQISLCEQHCIWDPAILHLSGWI